jgi:2-dehydro-3-deoxyphosphogluconate aldolase/(4S)-4-hydroxy-2-oxoglutarate aldolase
MIVEWGKSGWFQGMNAEYVKKRIIEIGIVPVVRASSSREAMLAVDAICSGGIPVAEITMTVPGAVEIIRELAKTRGSDVLIGAGTVLDAETAAQCLDAGAQFIVSPGLDVNTIELVAKRGSVIMAGALTPTEVITAWKAGADFVKVFPCGQVGGPKYIQALRGPLPNIPLVPTGGVNLTTAVDFILAGSAALGVGGELVQSSALKDGHPEIITDAARKFVELVKLGREKLAHANGQPATQKVRA